MPVCPSYEDLAVILETCDNARRAEAKAVLDPVVVADVVKDLIRCRHHLAKIQRPLVPRPAGFDRDALERGDYGVTAEPENLKK